MKCKYSYKIFILCSFSDRGKRLKLQQFIAKKADALYDKTNLETTAEPIKQQLGDEGKFILGKKKFFLLIFMYIDSLKSLIPLRYFFILLHFILIHLHFVKIKIH